MTLSLGETGSLTSLGADLPSGRLPRAAKVKRLHGSRAARRGAEALLTAASTAAPFSGRFEARIPACY